MEPQENWLVFNGKASTDFGIYISGSGTFSSPERDYTAVEIPGRSGDLFIDNGRFKNIDVSYMAWIAEEMQPRLRAFRTFIGASLGYCRLEDTYHPDEFRLASYKGGVDASVSLLQFVQFSIKFNCKPQRFLKIGEESKIFTANGTIINPSSMASKPKIRVYGYGTFVIGDYSITIASHSMDYIDIDSELMDCYCGTTNGNTYVTLTNGFPQLKEGSSGITIQNSTITKLEITPRWWIL